jgi:anaerobic ribonucleoside-triphosphate reductase
MNIDLLNATCKDATRNAFDEFKRQIDVRLFPFDEDLKDNLQKQMLEQIGQKVIKTMFKYEVNEMQLKIIDNYLNSYRTIALKTSNNYSKKYL